MEEIEDLIADIAAWPDTMLAAGEDVPDFWDEQDTSSRLAKWLWAHGWRKAE